MGLCALCTYVWNQSLRVCRLIDQTVLPPWQTALKHKRLWEKRIRGEDWSPPYLLYTDMHILPFVSCSLLVFSFLHLLILEKRFNEKHSSSPNLLTVGHTANQTYWRFNTSTVQNLDTCSVVQNLYKPQQVSSVVKYREVCDIYSMNQGHPTGKKKTIPSNNTHSAAKTQRQSLTAARRQNTVCANRQDWGGLFHLCGTSEGRVFYWRKQHFDKKRKKKNHKNHSLNMEYPPKSKELHLWSCRQIGSPRLHWFMWTSMERETCQRGNRSQRFHWVAVKTTIGVYPTVTQCQSRSQYKNNHIKASPLDISFARS